MSKDKFVVQFNEIRDLEMKFDRQRLQQVLMNIMTNAIKFTNGGKVGKITIEGNVHIRR